MTATKEKVSVIFNHKLYDQSQIQDFYGFIAWRVGDEQFTLFIDDRGFKVTFGWSSVGHFASTDNYDGPEDKINSAWGMTKAEALESLVEKLSEAIYEERI